MLDLLFDVNQSQQIPPEKRVNLALTPPAEPDESDVDGPPSKPLRSLEELLKEVPHSNHAQALDRLPALVADMEPFQGEQKPPSFLTADELDDCLYEIDRDLDENPSLPTLAPKARPGASANSSYAAATSQNIALRNPTSVYNWLRKHAPKTFLQDAEASTSADKNGAQPDETPAEGKRKRQSNVGGGASAKAERGTGRGSRGGKRRSTAADRASTASTHAKDAPATAEAGNASMDEDNDTLLNTPAATASRGGSKRKRDDDPGYRPKGGSSSRPSKKKRKSGSAGGGDGEAATPTASKGGAGSSRRGKRRLSEGPLPKTEQADE